MPSDVLPQNLEASARRELRSLGRANAENVARHLVMVQRLLDSDPELAYQHARYAASHAGRVAVVRESAGIAAYLSGHYNEALREIRAARRLSGLDLHRAIEADCERALGRYNQALKVAQEADPRQLDDLEEAELAMVVSGVRHDMGQSELGLVVIEEAIMMFRGDRETLRRLHSVRADRLEELGRGDEAAKIRKRIGIGEEREPAEEVEVYDIEDDYEEEQHAVTVADAPQASEEPSAAPEPSETAEVAESREASHAVGASVGADDSTARTDPEGAEPEADGATAVAGPAED
ncbi:HAD hydrolase, IIA [Actinomyces succiniciruminis]|uniref:HAD hydrolase, IIA n=2 Tax=Actinomyces succiniciruminis TaxID=1522002 RepID=A0A1L7RDZ4_9ACTO|nr:HAD hydrolase, IIA [Actinomyces succiniciruminis]